MKRLLFLLLICLLLSGCEKRNQFGLENVKGQITLNGNPVALSVIFDPIDKTSGLIGSSAFSGNDGTFQLSEQSALKAGKYRVRFALRKAYRKDSLEPIPDGADVDRSEVILVSILPEEFTTEKSQVEFEVVKGEKNVFTYDIASDYVPSAKDIRAKGSRR